MATDGIEVTGFVPDVDAYLRRCAVFVAPLRFGGGVKNKVLVAMAQGIPVVATRLGVEGIDGLVPECVRVGDSAEQLAAHIAALFENPAQADVIGRAGWNVVKTGYSWDKIISRLHEIYDAASPRGKH